MRFASLLYSTALLAAAPILGEGLIEMEYFSDNNCVTSLGPVEDTWSSPLGINNCYDFQFVRALHAMARLGLITDSFFLLP